MRVRIALAAGLLAAASLQSSVSLAQSPPTRFYGAILINGVPAPADTEIKALINGNECGMRLTPAEGIWVVDAADESALPGCGTQDAEVIFLVNGQQANQIGLFSQGAFIEVGLMVGESDAVAPPLPAFDPPPAEPEPEAPPVPEDEGIPEQPPLDGEPLPEEPPVDGEPQPEEPPVDGEPQSEEPTAEESSRE